MEVLNQMDRTMSVLCLVLEVERGVRVQLGSMISMYFGTYRQDLEMYFGPVADVA